MKIIYSLIFVSGFWLVACNTPTESPSTSKSEPVEISEVKDVAEVIKDVLKTEYDSIIPVATEHLKSHFDLLAFYELNQWQPLWTKTNEVDSLSETLLKILESADQYGLEKDMFHVSQIRSIFERSHSWSRKERLEAEFLMTDAFMIFASALRYGMVDPETKKPVYKAFVKEGAMPSLLLEFAQSSKPEIYIDSLESKNPRYIALRNAFRTYMKQHGKDNTRTHIPDAKTDSIGSYGNGFLALVKLGYLKNAEVKESEGIKALKRFQADHGLEEDGRIGKNTSTMLSKSVLDYLKILAANMEKSKWESFSDSEYVFLNIPAYRLEIIRNDSLIKEHKVIVGSTVTPTPEFSSNIQYFVTFPYWFVPHSISTKEIAPSVRRDPEYLSKKNYQVFDWSRKPVDPSEIAWTKVGPGNFPYYIRQDGGEGNSLGLIKFIFPNKYSVYLHDTPTKSLFGKDIRAFSHGCMRLHKPMDFAAYLVDREAGELTRDSLDTLIMRNIRKQINLRLPLPIHIRYYTAEVSRQGKLTIYRDIYKKDD